ncbi:uncharacterized protein RJT20DRAFT_127930 [Scheffersomyces xylosifermentans]|uniref:uncharacterized protein n=1 Tax=Scheffersomyces xylosifermentans TaxID=1304137 RepID=UPI00315C9434
MKKVTLIGSLFMASAAWALGEPQAFFFNSSASDVLPLYTATSKSSLLLDTQDWPGVLRAGQDLSADFGRVTGDNDSLPILNYTGSADICSLINGTLETAIIIGTIGNSSLIDSLVSQGKLNVSDTEGLWEAFTSKIIASPLPCIANALVIAGSDKRGSIFGTYYISEQVGVSPWYWWADVEPAAHSEIYVSKNLDRSTGEPSVKYRGFFFNDEQPALTGWVDVKFPEGLYDSHFVHEFYIKVFELLLRMKANFLWPAMWNSMFGVDDPKNQYWADYYGVIMGTSHTEPLMRATNEWTVFGNGSWAYDTNKENILEFWEEGIERSRPYENLWTVGMRGFGDTAMSGGVEIGLLEDVIKNQRELLSEAFPGEDITEVPQVWCLYKEVQSYFQQGMQVPDDITLLWVDDNWGNIRRLPLGNETDRAGGAGVYFHFDYVGSPVDYKWINTISNERTWEQMHLAYERQARTEWLVNIGDLKGLEVPIDYFMSLAYDFDTWGPVNKVMDWTIAWATREFGSAVDYNQTTIEEIADIVDLYGFLSSRKKYESLNTTTFSLTNYNEAKLVLEQWKDLSDRAQKIYDTLPAANQPSFFQLVLHPANAGYIVYDILISGGKNNLYATQRRNSANALADHVNDRFEDDYKWKLEYDSILEGKWVHFMDQTHLGYFYWQQPMRNMAPPVARVNPLENALSGAMALTGEQSQGSVPGDSLYNPVAYSNNTMVLPSLDPFSLPAYRWIEVFNRGNEDFYFEVNPTHDYIKVEPSSGSISASNDSIWNSQIVEISVDWSKVPEGTYIEYINVTSNSSYGNFGQPDVHLPLTTRSVPKNFTGFVESSQVISIEAEHFSKNVSQNETEYVVINRYGRTLSGVTLFPVTADSQEANLNSSYLEYNLYSYSTPHYGANVTVYLSPSLNTNPDRPLKYAISIDDEEPQEIQVVIDPTNPSAMPAGWETSVSDSIWLHQTNHNITSEGEHVLRLWATEPAVVFQKLVVDFGGVVPSFLGPPETYKQ